MSENLYKTVMFTVCLKGRECSTRTHADALQLEIEKAVVAVGFMSWMKVETYEGGGSFHVDVFVSKLPEAEVKTIGKNSALIIAGALMGGVGNVYKVEMFGMDDLGFCAVPHKTKGGRDES